MSKKKYRDYTNFSSPEVTSEVDEEKLERDNEEPLTTAEEEIEDLTKIVETVKELREDKNPDELYFKKEEEGDPTLEVNTFNANLKKGKINCPNGNQLRVRTSAAVLPNNIMGTYDNETEVTILKDQGEWLFVEISKNSIQVRGFVMSKFISKED